MDNQLQAIQKLIRGRQPDAARAALSDYLKANPGDATGWYLLSLVEARPAQRWRAIQRAAELDPTDEKIEARLAKLRADQPRRSRWLLPVILGFLLVGVAAALVVILSGRPTADDQTPLPTLAVLSSATPTQVTDSQIAALPTQPSEPPSATPTDEPTTIPPSPTAATPTSPTPTPTTEVIATREVLPTVTLPGASPSEKPPLLPILPSPFTPPPTLIVNPTAIPPTQPAASTPPPSTPTATTQPAVTGTTPAATPPTAIPPTLPGSVIPIGSAADIGSGVMRIIQVARPGSGLIQELGGSAPNPPANQEWVVVEILLVCQDGANCSSSLAQWPVTGVSGAAYTPSPQFQLSPVFGPGAFSLGQVWGYAGYLVPKSETSLALQLTTADNQIFRFALQ